MTRPYRIFGPELKLKIAIEALRNEKTISQIASEFEVHPSQVVEWKKQLQENACNLFSGKKKRKNSLEPHQDAEYLLRELGKVTAQLEWLKKKLNTRSLSMKGGNG